MNLVWMGFTIENFLHYMDGIGDNDDFEHILFVACLVDTASNSEELCFSISDKYCVINHLGQRMID